VSGDHLPPGESGDRTAFLGRIRRRTATAPPPNLAHPPPAPLTGPPPIARSVLLDADDLVGSFCRNALEIKAGVHRVTSAGELAAVVGALVTRLGVRRAVASKQPEAWSVVERLTAAGVDVQPLSRDASAAADLGVTVATAAIATTGTVVQRSDVVGGRTASLLPPVHLCLVPASCIVANSADVLRRLGDEPLPSNVVLITGPSRSADIEQIIAMGVHGPVAVELVVLEHD
jgi:L-lactate dehydrogenase complex protein LldG